MPEMSIGGAPIGWSKVNDGRNVLVDDGGNWAASVDLPLVVATTGSGTRTIRITDSQGPDWHRRCNPGGSASFDITPPEGRVGTLAVVRGVGYPSKNDEGHSFTVDVIYKVQEGATARGFGCSRCQWSLRGTAAHSDHRVYTLHQPG